MIRYHRLSSGIVAASPYHVTATLAGNNKHDCVYEGPPLIETAPAATAHLPGRAGILAANVEMRVHWIAVYHLP